MQREIKFRTYDIRRNVMDYNCENISLFVGEVQVDGNLGSQITVMEYTGLKDKNGKEIYEGDILAYYHIEADEISHNPVTFKDGCFMTGRLDLCPLIEDLEYKTLFEITVVGNIYQHHELLSE